MFCLSEIEHTFRLPPNLLNLPLNEAIKGELERLFLDKVIANLGLCISVYDLQSIDGGFIFPSDGASTYTVKFRLMMFRPFLGEIIAAKLKDSNDNGLRRNSYFPIYMNFINCAIYLYLAKKNRFFLAHCILILNLHFGTAVSLGFFDDIYVPVHLMPHPSHSEPDADNKKLVRWIWEFNEENYPIDGVDEIRFRVHNVNYPSVPDEQEKESKPFAPMVVTGSLDADGLGPISWWV